MTTILELAERLERADGPDRGLDVEIAVAVDWRWDGWEEGESTARGQADARGIDWLAERATSGMNSMWRGIPAYTTSLDAAMTLAPEGWSYIDFLRYADGTIECTLEAAGLKTPGATGAGRSQAIALCAAALRARHHIEGHKE